MTIIKAIIFDCDGTLIDSEFSHFDAYRHALLNQGFDFTVAEYLPYVGKSTETIADLLSKKINKDCSTEILKDKIAHFKKLQKRGIPPIKPTIDFIKRLLLEKTENNFKLGVASAVSRDEIFTNLKNLGIENYFDIVLSGLDDLSDYQDPDGVNKPKPYIYQQTAKLLNLNPSQLAVIEDSNTGVAASVDAGCKTIAVPNSYSKHQDLSRAHFKFESFTNLSVADFLQMLL